MFSSDEIGALAFTRIAMECRGYLIDTSSFMTDPHSYPTTVVKKLQWDSDE